MTLESNTAELSPRQLFWQGTVAMMPLSIAVIPWGLLVGSFAMDSGFHPLEAQALSAILFAGSVQLVAVGMVKAGVGLVTMLITTLFITSRHLIYSVTMRRTISPLPMRWRLGLGFLLTDELFALVGTQSAARFSRWFALGAGLSFYVVWNVATFVGIFTGQFIPQLNHLGLEFAVAATFIAIVVPAINNLAVLASVMVALVLSVALSMLHVQGSLIFAAFGAMVAGFLVETIKGERL